MPRRDPLREALERLKAVRRDPSSPASREELRRALEQEGAPAAAKAAAIAAEAGLLDLVPALVAAFGRFLAGLPRSDPGCAAKTAIVEALLCLDHEDEEILTVGIRHVQREPVLGGRVDTAAPLRGACARGLACTSGPDVLVALGSPPTSGRSSGKPSRRLKSRGPGRRRRL